MNGPSPGGPAEFEAPRTPVEEMIAEMWAEVLNAERVGVQDNFFGLGGHSLLAIETVARLHQRFAVELSVNEFFTNPTAAQQAVLVSERLSRDGVPAAGRAALEEALHSRRKAAAREDAIPPRDRSRPCPLSPAQERLWFLQQLNPDFRAYNEAEAIRLRGSLHADFLEDALNVVVARHESLRTIIEPSGERPIQTVLQSWRVCMELIDLTGRRPEQREAEVERLLRDEPRRPFDLTAAPGIRAALVRCGPEDHVFIVTLHHMTCDGWSLPLLYHELAAAYRAACRGEPLDLGPAPLQYPDFAAWKARQVQEGVFSKELSFWKDYLRGAPTSLELPALGPRPERFTYVGEKRSYPLGRDVTEGFHDLSRREQLSLFTVLAAAFNVLLSRYSGLDDVVLGIPIANRDRPELLSLFGFLIDFQALRTDLSGDPTFRELLLRVRQGILDVNAHRGVPFNMVVEALNPPRDLSRAPLFQTLLVWKDRHVQMQFMELEGLSTSHVQAHPGISKFDLTVWLTDVEDDIWLEVEHCTDLFDADMIRQLVEAYRVVLKAVVADPEQHLASLPVLTPEVRQRLMVDWNDTRADYPCDAFIHELFEAQAERAPENVAVVLGDRSLTYGELNARANQLAHYLRSLGVGPDTLVGICAERSPEMVIGLLGILKAGGAYVPLDPGYPPARLEFMLQDAHAPVLLTQSHLIDRLPRSQARLVRLDADWGAISHHGTANPTRAVSAENLAYVIYTSGSTGKPKGAQNTHRGISNRLLWMQQTYRLDGADAVLQKTPFSFDVSVWEFFWPLLAGARLVLARPGGHGDPTYLARLIRDQGVTVCHFVPSMLQAFLEEPGLEESCASLRDVICSGEALTYELQERFFARLLARLHNLYGPTEAAVDVTFWECRRGDASRVVPIGRPVANTQMYVLDKNLQPAPLGVAGELYIGGVQLRVATTIAPS